MVLYADLFYFLFIFIFSQLKILVGSSELGGDRFISLERIEPEPVQEVFLLNITPESSHETLVLQLLLDPSTDISVVARHFGLGLVGSKFIPSLITPFTR